MMRCLYRGDYGPADPGFDAGTAAHALGTQFPAYTNVLATAQNVQQMEALLQRLEHGDSVAWCETGYGRVLHQPSSDGFTLAATLILLPLACWRFSLWMRRRGY